jgi:hypothetical protein
VSTLQKVEDIFFEIGADVNLALIQEGRRAACLNLPCDLLCYPCIRAAVADKNQSLCGLRRFTSH